MLSWHPSEPYAKPHRRDLRNREIAWPQRERALQRTEWLRAWGTLSLLLVGSWLSLAALLQLFG